jgi:hypothetical protein
MNARIQRKINATNGTTPKTAIQAGIPARGNILANGTVTDAIFPARSSNAKATDCPDCPGCPRHPLLPRISIEMPIIGFCSGSSRSRASGAPSRPAARAQDHFGRRSRACRGCHPCARPRRRQSGASRPAGGAANARSQAGCGCLAAGRRRTDGSGGIHTNRPQRHRASVERRAVGCIEPSVVRFRGGAYCAKCGRTALMMSRAMARVAAAICGVFLLK